MLCCCGWKSKIESWARDYDLIQSFVTFFIYLQIGCALVGSLGALYTGALLINVAISLFALVAIESSSQSLTRAYAVLLFSAILIDIAWFILFTHEIWNISSETYGAFVIFSVELTFWMQVIGFCMRLLSSFLWVQMYRLGVSYTDSSATREADYDLRNSFLSPAHRAITRRPSGCDEALGGSIYDTRYYSSLFEDGQENGYSYGGNHLICHIGSTSKAEASKVMLGQNHDIRHYGSSSKVEPSQFVLKKLLHIFIESILLNTFIYLFGNKTTIQMLCIGLFCIVPNFLEQIVSIMVV